VPARAPDAYYTAPSTAERWTRGRRQAMLRDLMAGAS